MAVLGLMFLAVSMAALLGNVLAGKLEMSVLAALIGLRTLIVLDVLLPSALYVAVIVSMRRLHRDMEITALWSFGLSDARIVRAVFVVILGISVLVSLVSVFGRPWAYKTSYDIEEQASLLAGMQRLKPDRFVSLGEGDMTVFFEDYDEDKGVSTEVFVQQKDEHSSRVIRARAMHVKQNEGQLQVLFEDGHVYETRDSQAGDRVLSFHRLEVGLNLKPVESVRNKRKAVATAELSESVNPKEIAEYQWRLTTPVSTFLLGIVAIPLGRVGSRRHSGGIRLIIAIILYVLFFYLTSTSRTWLEHGDIGAMPGLWWVQGGIALTLLVYFSWRRFRFLQ